MYKGKSDRQQQHSRREALRPDRHQGGGRNRSIKPVQSTDRFRTAVRRDEVVVGRVTRVRKGGFDIDSNGVTCFCPASQIDAGRASRAEVWVGKSLRFVVLRASRRDVVLSRRRLLEREHEGRLNWCRRCCDEGYAARGKVFSNASSGFVITLGNGVFGRLPAAEVSVHGERLVAAYRNAEAVLVAVVSVEGNRVGVSLEMLPPRVAREPTAEQLRGRPQRSRKKG